MKAKLRPYIPNRIDRYITLELFGPLVGGVLLLIFLFIMFQILRLAELLITHHAPPVLLGKMMLMMIVQALPVALPMAFLGAVIVTFGRLSGDSEFVAFKACGISVSRLSYPVLFSAVLCGILGLALNLEWTPWAERATHQTVLKMHGTTAVAQIQEGTFTTGFFGILIYAEKVDRKTGQMRKVFIYDEREAGHPMAVVAQTGQLLPVKTGKDLGGAALLRLFSGSIHNYDNESQAYQKTDFGEYKLFLKVDEAKESNFTKHKMHSWTELGQHIESEHSRYGNSLLWRELKTEQWRRLTLALSPLFFAFLGIGLGSFHSRNVKAGAGIVTLGVILLYWGAQTYSADLSNIYKVPAWLAMQIPNLIVMALTIVPYRRASF